MPDETKLKTVTRVSWESLREPFRKVYSGVMDSVKLMDGFVHIYRVGKITRIDIKDPNDR